MPSSDDRHNILHVILDLELAGAQESLCTLAEHLQANDWALTVCAFRDGPLRKRIEASGVAVELLKPPRCTVSNLSLYLAEIRRIRRELLRLVKARKVSLIQTHILGPLDFLTLSLRYTTKLKGIFWTIHGIDFLPARRGRFLQTRRFISRCLYRLLANKVDGFIAVCDSVRQSVIRQLGPINNKIVVINNGVSLKRFVHPGNRPTLCTQLGIDPQARLVLSVGRLAEEKGHRYLIKAAPRVMATCPRIHFLLAGEGELREGLQALADKTGCSNRIHFLGLRNDVPDLMAVADLFVLPSLSEAMPMALLEAMGAGVPIVATAVPGIEQLITPYETGLIVPPGDSMGLTDAINLMLTHPERARKMGRSAQQYVTDNYSAEKQASEYLALYRAVLKPKRYLPAR